MSTMVLSVSSSAPGTGQSKKLIPMTSATQMDIDTIRPTEPSSTMRTARRCTLSRNHRIGFYLLREQLSPARGDLLRRLGVLGGRGRVFLPLGQEVGRGGLPLLQLLRREGLERAAGRLDVGYRLLLEVAYPREVVVHRLAALVTEDLLDVLRKPAPGALAHGDVVACNRHHRAAVLLADFDQPVLLDVARVDERVVQGAVLQRLVDAGRGHRHRHRADG